MVEVFYCHIYEFLEDHKISELKCCLHVVGDNHIDFVYSAVTFEAN